MFQTHSTLASSERRRALRFFALTTAFSIPLWLLGSLVSDQILPGLPMSSLMVLCPVSAALILLARDRGRTAALALLKRALGVRWIHSTYGLATAALLKPFLFLVAYGLMRLRAVPMPPPQVDALTTLPLLGIFFLAALAEEIGWMGYAYDPLERRWGALGAALGVGLFWIAWHLVPFLQADRSLAWIAWQSLYLLSSRVLLVWIFKNTGRSIFAAALFHATGNLSWQLFPVQGSHYDPRITGLLFTVVAVAVILHAGPRELSHERSRRRAKDERAIES